MKLNELYNNKTAFEEALDLFHKTEETDDGYITWCDGKGIPQLQVNLYNGIIYILTDNFRIILNIKEKALEERKKIEERKKQFDPFYLDPQKSQVSNGSRIVGKKSSYQEHTEEEEKPKKKQERLPLGERVNIDYLVNIDEYLNNYERDILINERDRGFVVEEHEPRYIDRYTTAYNSDIMRAILSHQ